MRHVIIGGGIAGISAARTIPVYDGDADITLVSAEKAKPYYRPMIPAVIQNVDADVSLTENPIEKYNLCAVYDRLEGIDPQAREVRLASGGRIRYEKLLIATGSSPVFPVVPGLQGTDVYPLRTLEDARNIRAAAAGRRSAVVLGGGFVGIKAAIALRGLGLAVTIVEKLGRILYEKLDRRGSSIIGDILKRNDIDIVTNQQDYEVVRDCGQLRSVRLAAGRIIDADIMVVAVGSRPNTQAFRDVGIRTNNGIIVQPTLETSLKDVYAAGDVVEYRDPVLNTLAVSALWTNAEEMGRLAGKNMTGLAVKYEGFLSVMNSVDILNVPVTTVGLIDPENGGHEVFADGGGDTYRKLVFKNDVLVGALFIGSRDGTGVYTSLIRNRTPLGKLKSLAIKGKLGYVDIVNSPFLRTQ